MKSCLKLGNIALTRHFIRPKPFLKSKYFKHIPNQIFDEMG